MNAPSTMRGLVPALRDRPVLLVGKHYPKIKEIAASYGFRKAVTLEELHAAFPHMYPDIAPPPEALELVNTRHAAGESIGGLGGRPPASARWDAHCGARLQPRLVRLVAAGEMPRAATAVQRLPAAHTAEARDAVLLALLEVDHVQAIELGAREARILDSERENRTMRSNTRFRSPRTSSFSLLTKTLLRTF